MVCPVCVIPIAGVLGATGSGKIALTGGKWSLLLWILSFGLTALSLYVYFNRKKLKTECKMCTIE